jgi:glycosyltransferase involved in cell wall biosynthesis
MIKILFIHHATGWGGAPNAMIKLIKTLDYSKYQIEVLLIKDSVVAQKLEENGIKYSVAKSVFYKKYYFGFIHSEAGYYKWYQIYYLLKSILFWILSRFYFAKKELENHEFDIVHLNSSIMSDWLAPAKAKGKVIIHIREPFRKGKFDLFNYVFTSQMRKYADEIIAISEDNAQRIGIPNKTEVVYDYSELSTCLPPDNSYYSRKVLYLGGSASIKGFYEMVEALNFIEKDIKVYFAGSYDNYVSKSIIKRLIQNIISSDKVNKKAINKMKKHPNAIELGLIYDVPKYLQEVCCLVSPFAKPHFSLPVIEAFANYKTAIVTNIEGASEVVKHEINGLIVPQCKPEVLAEAINFICSNGNLALEMGKNGFNDAQVKYSSSNMNKIAAIYDRLYRQNL